MVDSTGFKLEDKHVAIYKGCGGSTLYFQPPPSLDISKHKLPLYVTTSEVIAIKLRKYLSITLLIILLL